MNIYQEKYLILLSATSDAIFRLQAITQMLTLAQQEAEQVTSRKSRAVKRSEFDAAREELQAAIKTLLPKNDEEQV